MMLFISIVTAWGLSLPYIIGAQSIDSEPETTINNITCYDFDGYHLEQRQQCPGSQTCCASVAYCLPNKMCLGLNELIRPACAVYPWDNSTCSPLCLFVTGTRKLPRIQMCSDGSYCCNADALCCSKKEGKFVDARGNLISNPYTTATSESSTGSTSSQPQPTSATGAADASDNTGVAAPVPTDPASKSKGSLAATKGGIGALARVLLLVAVAASFFVWKTRRKFRSLKSAPTQTQPELDVQPMFAQKHEMGYGPAELRVTDRGNSDGRQELASDRTSEPRELPSDPVPSRRHA